jgi:hypothetical protein
MYEADLIPDIFLEILAPIAPASEEQAALNPGIAGLASAVDAVVHEPNGVRDATLQAVAKCGVLCSIPDWHPTAEALIANRGLCSIPDGSRFQKGESAWAFSASAHIVFTLFADPC